MTDYFNSSSLYYTSSHAAALVFVHCQINITQVNIYNSYGFAMIGINLNDSSISEVSISYSTLSTNLYRHNEDKRRTIGCGALLHFVDHQLMMYPTYVTVNYTHFKNNFDLHEGNPYTTEFSNNYLNIVNAAGLTVLYTQKTYFASVTINNTEFTSNVGSYNYQVVCLFFITTVLLIQAQLLITLYFLTMLMALIHFCMEQLLLYIGLK